MRNLFLISFLATCTTLLSQTTTSFIFHSDTLNEDRNIRIHLPKSFDATATAQYPLILVLDGEYLFYSVLGVSEVLTTRKLMPESIVVGIDQNYLVKDAHTARWLDCAYDSTSGELKEKGIKFKSFIEHELLPVLAKTYKVGQFKSIAGHSFTANYIHYFLDNTLFSGFIAISPYIPNSVEASIKNTIEKAEKNIYYYLCTGENDLSGHISQIKKQDTTLFSQIKNVNFHYQFKNYEAESHMSLPVRSISDVLTLMYSDFSPIYALNMDDQLLKEKDLITYLQKRYQNIETTYGISMPYREDDITSISWIIEEQENWDALKQIGEMATALYPESVYGYFMIALSEEKKNNLVVALAYYKKGYAKLGDDVGNKSDFYADIERIEKLLKKK